MTPAWHALERQNEELKEKVAELEAALERKTEATTEAPKEEGSEEECQRRVTCHRVQMVAAADPDDRGRVALRRGQFTSSQVEARQNRRTDSTEVTEGDPCGRTARPGKRKSPDIARIGNAVHRVQRQPRAKMIVAHVDRLASYLGPARDEQP
jgi:hypothetical protein